MRRLLHRHRYEWISYREDQTETVLITRCINCGRKRLQQTRKATL